MIKFSVDRHFIYITTRADDNKEQLQSYYNLIEEDLVKISKEWSTDLLVLVDPAEMSDIDSPEATQDTPGPNKTKKTKKMKKRKEVQDIDRLSVRTTSIIPDQGGDGEELEEFE